jgi:hypothetical protein
MVESNPFERSPAVSPSTDRGPTPTTERAPPFIERRVNQGERRNVTLRTILRSIFTPRRRSGRRVTDRDLPIDLHEPYLLLLSIVMLLLSVADAFLTVTLMTDGAQETNPLLAFVLNEHPRLFAVVKIALTGLGVVVLVAVARTRIFRIVRAAAFLQGLVAAYFALVAYETWLVSSMFSSQI